MIFLLDTMVVSEPVKARPDPAVMRWYARHTREAMFIATVTLGEIATGIARLPTGRRRQKLQDWQTLLVDVDFQGRILDFDIGAALTYGRLVAETVAAGHNPTVVDAQIAAVAVARPCTLVTRNIRHFAPFGVDLVDPWQA